jgi:hypothetical protein
MQLFTVAILILSGFIEQVFGIAAVVATTWLGFDADARGRVAGKLANR